MPEPVSVTMGLWCLGYTALHTYARGGSAISTEAQAVRKAACGVVESVERSQALFGPKATALSEIAALVKDCSEEGWDGDEAKPIHWAAARNAEELVRILPDHLPLPEFAPEPDGSISLDWIPTGNRMLSVSVGPSNRLAYAWLDGADKGHGVTTFDGEVFPLRIIEAIKNTLNLWQPYPQGLMIT